MCLWMEVYLGVYLADIFVKSHPRIASVNARVGASPTGHVVCVFMVTVCGDGSSVLLKPA